MAILRDGWHRVKAKLRLRDLLLDVGGKSLVFLGIGALLSEALQSCAWSLIIVGILPSLYVKTKYWNVFWGRKR